MGGQRGEGPVSVVSVFGEAGERPRRGGRRRVLGGRAEGAERCRRLRAGAALPPFGRGAAVPTGGGVSREPVLGEKTRQPFRCAVVAFQPSESSPPTHTPL